jgi:epoxyqueuosine reductase
METLFEYEYRVVPIDRMPELQAEVDSWKHSNRISDQPLYRSHIDNLGFTLPVDFPEAKSLIVLALFTPPALANLWLDGTTHEVIIPPGYYHAGFTIDNLSQEICKNVIGDTSARLERAEAVHLKLLAVRSGLGQYGRNNICYVNGMGSFITLYAFFTDRDLHRDNWEEIRLLELCNKCRVCLKTCPTGAIRVRQAVIDAGQCLTLYNEDAHPFPNWIPPGVHNALIGCTRCQWPCPANKKALQRTLRFEDVEEDETRDFLSSNPSESALEIISEKLHLPYMPGSMEMQTVFIRNLRYLINRSE